LFYRCLYERRYTSVDLTNAYSGTPVFIIGGNPSLKTLPLDRLESSRLPTLALNNALYVYPNPTMWLTADRPLCYGGHFFARPDITKFAYMNYRDEVVQATGRALKDHPMMLFYTASEGEITSGFFEDKPAFTWCKSVFPLALQLAWRAGARRVYLVGCSFLTNGQVPYAWGARLTPPQVTWSQLTYDDDINRLRRLRPIFDAHGFEIVSCTPNSRANEIFPLVDLASAIAVELARLPQPTPVSELIHSSETRLPGL